ncbi:hypothetical protein ACTFIY_004617, partial [Dictyostelium cf. discoideum]
DRCRGF